VFESICVRRQNFVGPQVMDPGFLAETLLFYGHVRLIADGGMLKQLLESCGADTLVELITERRLEVNYVANGLGVKTENTGTPNELHVPTTYKIIGRSEMQDVVPSVFQEVTGKTGRGRRLAQKVLPHIRELSFGQEVVDSARRDYTDPEFMSRAAAAILTNLAPAYPLPEPLRFEVVPTGDLFRVRTNVDFQAATVAHRAYFGSGIGDLTPAYVLGAVLNAGGDLHLAALYSTELATDALSRSLIESKCRELLAGRSRREGDIRMFQELVLEQANAIREAVNSRERTFEEVLKLVASADRFRQWVRQQDPSVDLATSYYRQVTEGTWVTTLPAKALRWAVAVVAGVSVGGLGLEGAAVTAGLGAADMFIIERLATGWRPNQFVEGRLKPFVRGR